MDEAANRIIDHYERHALSWDADCRAAAWIDRPFIERFLRLPRQGASILDLGCGGGAPVADDELMDAGKYASAVTPIGAVTRVMPAPGVDHMGALYQPAALAPTRASVIR